MINKGDRVLIRAASAGVHFGTLESQNGSEVWTKEHADIDLSELPNQVRHGDVMLEKTQGREYRFIQQQVYDPLTKRIEDARD